MVQVKYESKELYTCKIKCKTTEELNTEYCQLSGIFFLISFLLATSNFQLIF